MVLSDTPSAARSVFFLGQETRMSVVEHLESLAVEHAQGELQDEAAEVAQASKSKRKHPWSGQRDSLARRNRLLVGKEGSRRRQRYDNNQFSDHPLAVLHEEDLCPPGYQYSSGFHWASQDVLDALEDELDAPVEPPKKSRKTATLVNGQRTARKKMKNVPRGLVESLEDKLEPLLDKCRYNRECSERGELYDINADDTYLVLDPGSSFARRVLHRMCDYYNLNSTSHTTAEGRRLVYVCHQSHTSMLKNRGTMGDFVVLETASPNDWMVPELPFVNVMFTRQQ